MSRRPSLPGPQLHTQIDGYSTVSVRFPSRRAVGMMVFGRGAASPLPTRSPRRHLHRRARGPGLVERAPALPAVDGVLHLHAQLPGHRDLVVVPDVLHGPIGGGQIVGT